MEVQATGAVGSTLTVNDCSTCSTAYQQLPETLVVNACGVLKSKIGETAKLVASNSRTYITRELSWQELHSAANESIRQRHFDKAAAQWLKALEMLEFAPYTDPRLEKTLDCLVDTYQKLDNHKEASRYCLRSLEVKRIAYDHWNLSVADCLNKLAGIYYLSEQHDKVEKLCLEAEQIYMKLQGSDCKSICTLAGNLAYLYHAQKKFASAKKRYLQALKIKKAMLQEGDSEWVSLYRAYSYLSSTVGFD